MSDSATGSQRSVRGFLTSETIVLEATDSGTPFNVHESLLRSTSPALAAACSRDWKEGALRRYKFQEDVTEQVLLSFLTWAYYGDYHSGSGDEAVPSSLNSQTKADDLESSFNLAWATRSKKKKKKRELATALDYEIRSSPEDVPAEYREEGEAENADEKFLQNASLSVTSVAAKDNIVHPLLLHAKLYVFANMYLIEPLKASTKQKMIDKLQQLGNIPEGNERAAVFDVLAHTFSRLPEEDPLLHWLARYAS